MASLLTLLLGLVPASALAEEGRLILATTTSTADSGLLDYILPDFETIYNVKVDVIAVGTGQALKLGEAGDADVVLVHARSQEDAFVEAGYGVNRQDVMYNDFIIVGPSDDPAGIKGMKDVAQAFSKIAETKSTFISRGDESGTHVKEKSIWAKVGLEPKGDWYISAGQGMGEVLTMAEEQMAYTLSDRATYLSRTIEGIDLVILVEGDPILFNPYGVIAVNPELHPKVNYDLAMAFIDWMTSVQVQLKISQFRHPSGETLFYPNSEAWRKAQEIK
ncbi:MAG: substrate-binding domain-containing protein [Anaerolineae bacterium]